MRTMKKRRRFEGKTDYKARKSLLKSKSHRIVFRKTNRYIIGQYIKSSEAQDKISVSANSKELENFGWPKTDSIKSITAAYLTGFLLGKKIIDKEGKVNAILDMGLIRNIKKSKAYAFLKGTIDAGIEIPHNASVFPDEKRISGEHLKNKVNFKQIKEKINNG